MNEISLLDEVRAALRVSSNKLDQLELQPLIDSAKEDLISGGMKQGISETDVLFRRAVVFYCKANAGFSEDQDKWQARYDKLKNAIGSSVKRGAARDEVQ